jgi:hypothetical protein
MRKLDSVDNGRKCTVSLMLGLLAVTLASCSGGRVYRSERFEPDSPYHHAFDATVEAACGASGSALLSQGYLILQSSGTGIKANKEFQPKEEIHNDLEVTITCEQRGTQAIVYANAVQQRYEIKKSRSSTSFSVPRIGSLSLPGSSATEELIKTGSETVTDRDFYGRFFALVARLLGPVPPPPR